MDKNSLSHTRWNCKYNIVFASKYRRQIIYGRLKQDIGKNTKKIQEYIRNQLKEDYIADQISLKGYIDPFTGKKNKRKTWIFKSG